MMSGPSLAGRGRPLLLRSVKMATVLRKGCFSPLTHQTARFCLRSTKHGHSAAHGCCFPPLAHQTARDLVFAAHSFRPDAAAVVRVRAPSSNPLRRNYLAFLSLDAEPAVRSTYLLRRSFPTRSRTLLALEFFGFLFLPGMYAFLRRLLADSLCARTGPGVMPSVPQRLMVRCWRAKGVSSSPLLPLSLFADFFPFDEMS